MLVLYSCQSKLDTRNESSGENKLQDTSISINYSNLKISRIHGKPWQEYERFGSGDTALTLYAYRILNSKDHSGIDDCQSRANLILLKEKVLSIAPKLFGNKFDLLRFENKIDSLNSRAIEMAWEEIKQDRKLYGDYPASNWGPCDVLYSLKDSL